MFLLNHMCLSQIVHHALCAKMVGTGMDVKIYNVGSFEFPIDAEADLAR